MPFALASRGEDKLTWKVSDHGLFNLGSAYNLATKQCNEDSFKGTWIWKVRILPRIQSFVWLCCHESIGVKECLNRRVMLADTQCPLCHASSESILHAHDCEVVKQVWYQLGENWSNSPFFNSNLQDWLELNGTNQRRVGRHAMSWSVVFLFSIWLIWKQRNHAVFKEQRPNPYLAKDITRRALEFQFYASPLKEAAIRFCKPVRWCKLASGWVKLNTDGSSLGNPGLAGGGGLIRDEKGIGLPDLLSRLEKLPASLLNFGPFVMVLMCVLAITLLLWKWS